MRNRMSPEVMKRKGDVLMEAGRLAAEYLVSQGRLPPAVLTAARSPPPPPPSDHDLNSNPNPNPNPNLNLNTSVKDIEVIELDDSDSPPPQPPPKGETEEMISELLDDDDDNITAAAPGDGSEALPLSLPIAIPDDDSIYMSLGEIPLTYLRPHWEQPPPQDYDKPF